MSELLRATIALQEDTIERLEADNERLTARLKKQALLMVEQAKALGKLLHEIERLRVALRFIDDEAHDLNAAEECAREALAALETNDE